MTAPATIDVTVTHKFSASSEDVFNAWLDPNKISQWMFGPAIRDEVVVSIEVDARPGGAFSFLVQRQQQVIDHVGTYLKIEKPRALEFSWGVKGMGDSSRVLISISPDPSGCVLTLTHELDPAWFEYVDRCRSGWGDMLKALEKALKN